MIRLYAVVCNWICHKCTISHWWIKWMFMDLIDCNFVLNLTDYWTNWEKCAMRTGKVPRCSSCSVLSWLLDFPQDSAFVFSVFWTMWFCNPAQGNLHRSCWYFDSWCRPTELEGRGNTALQKGDCSRLILAWGSAVVEESWSQMMK